MWIKEETNLKKKDESIKMMELLSKLIKVDSVDLLGNEFLKVDRKAGNVVVGAYRIIGDSGFYRVMKGDETLYENICLMDIALLLVEYHVVGSTHMEVEKLLGLEREYYNIKSDMLRYQIMGKVVGADMRMVCEDRYVEARYKLHQVVEKILICKKRKNFSWA